jgi:hypothetical protein
MINANELRIGNNVFSPLWDNDIVVDFDNIIFHEDFTPIKITGELLVSLGFKKYNDNYSLQTLHGLNTEKPSRIVIRKTSVGNWVVISPANRTIYLKSLHQLQNLYFALTGYELQLTNSN